MKKFKVGLCREFLDREGKMPFGTTGVEYLSGFGHIDFAFLEASENPVKRSS